MLRWWRFAVSLRIRTATLALAGLIALASFLIFHWAPNRQVGDAKYTVLLAQNLVSHRDVHLERYKLEYPDYRIERLAGHDYYYFPVASSILSTPFVAAMNLIGRSPLKSDGTYDREREENLDVLLAHLLMAFFVAVTFLMARQVLPTPSSLAVTVVAGFG